MIGDTTKMTIYAGSQSHLSKGQNSASPPSLTRTQAVKIQLTSNNIGYGPPPNYDDEVEQRLTLTADGKVWFSSYVYGLGDKKYELNNIKRYKIDAIKAKKILSAFSRYFDEHFIPCFATDIGSWNLRITTADGTISHFEGSLCDDFKIDGDDLSDILRNTLGLESLWGFKET